MSTTPGDPPGAATSEESGRGVVWSYGLRHKGAPDQPVQVGRRGRTGEERVWAFTGEVSAVSGRDGQWLAGELAGVAGELLRWAYRDRRGLGRSSEREREVDDDVD